MSYKWKRTQISGVLEKLLVYIISIKKKIEKVILAFSA